MVALLCFLSLFIEMVVLSLALHLEQPAPYALVDPALGQDISSAPVVPTVVLASSSTAAGVDDTVGDNRPEVPEEHGAPVSSPPRATSRLDASVLELSHVHRLQGLQSDWDSFVANIGGQIHISVLLLFFFCVFVYFFLFCLVCSLWFEIRIFFLVLLKLLPLLVFLLS